MGKASSSKKVARAARAGGGRVSGGGRERNILFPAAIGVILLLGIGLVAFARSDYQESAPSVAPVAFQDHWHAAYGVYACGEWVTQAEQFQAADGIHSHGDELIHIHPYSQSASGENATLGKFTEEAPLVELSDSEVAVSDDQTWTEGEDTCGGEDAEVVVAQWEDASSDGDPAIIRSNVEDVRFRRDGEAYTIAFVPTDETDIPKPATASRLQELGAVDEGSELPEGFQMDDGAVVPEGGSEFGEGTGDGSTGTGGSGGSGEQGSPGGDSGNGSSGDQGSSGEGAAEGDSSSAEAPSGDGES